MNAFQQSSANLSPSRAERGVFQRVTVNMQGRLMLSNYEEYPCLAIEMSPGDLYLTCEARPRLKERVIAYVDHIGRVEGVVLDVDDHGFTLSVNATERKREKLASQLIWLANKHELGLPEDRRHDRLTPRQTTSQITLEDGTLLTCRIMDLSLSGAAVDVENRPPIGTPLRLGNMRGRVIRHFMEGVAIEFLSVQSRDTLREFL